MLEEPILSGIIIAVAKFDPLRELGTTGLLVFMIYLIGIPVMFPIAVNWCRKTANGPAGDKGFFRGFGKILIRHYGFILIICLVWPFAVIYLCIKLRFNFKLVAYFVIVTLIGAALLETVTRASSPALLTALESGHWRESREAKKLLFARADPATILPLMEIARTAPRNSIRNDAREHAMEALRAFRSREIQLFLLEALTNQELDLRGLAIRALRDYTDPQLVVDLVPLLSDRKDYAAREVTKLLGGLLFRLRDSGDPIPAQAVELLDLEVQKLSSGWTQRSKKEKLSLSDRKSQEYISRTLLDHITVMVLIDTPFTVAQLASFIGNQDMPRKARVKAAKGIRHLSANDDTVISLAETLMETKSLRVKYALIVSLGYIGNPSAVPYLIESLTDWRSGRSRFGDIQDEAATALGKLGWEPTTVAEIIHLAAARKNEKLLRDRWQDTKTVLLEDIASGNTQYFNNALLTFLRLGQDSVLPELVEILHEHGNYLMANAYLRSGNDLLETAAVTWANANGFIVTKTTEHVADYPKWGK